MAIDDYVKGKSVVLVCPSPHSLLPLTKDKIVVSINYPVEGATVLYSGLGGNAGGKAIRSFIDGGIKYIRAAHPYHAYCRRKPNFLDRQIKEFRERLNGRLPFDTMNKNKYECWSKLIKTRPYSGVAAVMDLLSIGVKRLHIVGMTFYLDGERGRPDAIKRMKWQLKKGTHNVEANRQLIRRVCFNNPVVTLCSYTAKALAPERIDDYVKEIKKWSLAQKKNESPFNSIQ